MGYFILGAIVCALLVWAYFGKFLLNMCVFLCVPFLVYQCTTSNWWEAKMKEDAKERQAEMTREATPRIVSYSNDGCAVYTFKAGDRWQYFTRCGAQTTTTVSETINCGKNCRKEEFHTITTEVAK